MGETAELIGHGRIDFRYAMAKKIAPKRRCAVEQSPAAIIDEIVPLGIHHDEWLGREVFLHLRERMPHMFRIPPPDVFW